MVNLVVDQNYSWELYNTYIYKIYTYRPFLKYKILRC